MSRVSGTLPVIAPTSDNQLMVCKENREWRDQTDEKMGRPGPWILSISLVIVELTELLFEVNGVIPQTFLKARISCWLVWQLDHSPRPPKLPNPRRRVCARILFFGRKYQSDVHLVVLSLPRFTVEKFIKPASDSWMRILDYHPEINNTTTGTILLTKHLLRVSPYECRIWHYPH
jgi:hypothetical protein